MDMSPLYARSRNLNRLGRTHRQVPQPEPRIDDAGGDMTEDQWGALVAGAIIAVASWGVWGVTVAAAAGRVRANGALGLRTTATTASEEAWEEAHRAALPVVRPLCLASGVTALAGALAGSWPPAGEVLVLIAAALLVGAAALGGVIAHRVARSVGQADQGNHQAS
jgi:hypothetical protein